MKTDTGQGNGRRLRRVALWTTAGLFIVAVLAVTWLMTADLGFVRPKIERTLTELTGRQFELRGGLEVDIGRQIVVVARDIRWQNADWDEPAEMLSVGYAEIHVDLWSLLNGPIEVEYVEVSDADVVVTQREDGRLNWDVFDIEPSEATGEAEEQGKGFLLRQVDVDDVRVVYTSPDRERPVRLHVAKLDQRHRDDDSLDLNLDGTLGERAINLTGESGPWSALQSGRDIRFDLKGVFGSLEWAADGQIDDVASPGKPEINVVAKAPSVDDIARMLGLADGGTGEIDIVAALAASEDGPLVLDVLASVGETELEAEGVVSDLGDLERVDLDLRASGPNLGGVLRFFGVDDVADGPFSINVDAKRDGELVDVQQARMMFGETQFLMNARLPAFPSLDDGSIDLNASGPDVEHFRSLFGLPGAATGPFSIDLDLTVLPDGIEAVRLVAETSLGRLAANGTLGDAPQYLGSRFDYTFDAGSLARIGNALDLDTLPDEAVSVSGSLEVDDGALVLATPAAFTLGDLSASLGGRVVLAEAAAGSALRVGVAGPNLAAAVGLFAEVDAVPEQPFEFDGRINLGSAMIDINSATLTLGSTNISMGGRLSLADGFAGSQGRVAAEGPAVEELVAELGGYSVRPGPFSMSGRFELQEDRLAVDDFLLERGRGSLTIDLALGLPLERRWADFSLSGSGADVRNLVARASVFEPHAAPFTLKSRGTLREDELVIDSFNVTLGDGSVSGDGRLGFGESARTRFSVAGRIPDMAALGTVDGREFSAQSLALSLDARGEGKSLDIGNLIVEMGGSDLQGTLRYAEGDVPRIEGRFRSDAFLIEPLFKKVELDVEPVAEREDERLIPDVALPLEAMRSIDADILIDIGVFRRGEFYAENVLFDAALQNGAVELRELRLDAKSGSLVSRGRLTPAEGGAQSEVELRARDLAFGLAETNRDLERTADIDLSVAFVGDDLRTMLAAANGFLLFDMRGGQVGRNAFLNALYGDVLQQLLSVINPFYERNKPTELDCLVAPFDIVDGRLDAEPRLIVRTGKLNLFVLPKINLGNERIDISIRTTPRRGISISTAELFNPFVKVVGTLGSPTLAVDEQGVLISGGAAVATGGLSILARAAWDRVGRRDNPCDSTREDALEAFADRMPALYLEPATSTDAVTNEGGSP